MMNPVLRAASLAAAVLSFAAAAPAADHASYSAPFPTASVTTLPNGVVIASQASPDTPLVGAQIFLPAGSAHQSQEHAGIAGVTAAMVMHTPVEGGTDLADVADRLGAMARYTIDPLDTRFSIECKASDLPRLLGDLSKALKQPDARTFAAARDAALGDANKAIKDPALTAYGMIRQAEFAGSGFARPDAGGPTALAALTPADALAFTTRLRHGTGTVVALTGDVTPEVLAAAGSAFADFAASPGTPAPASASPTRTREVVAHRDVASPWVAVGFAVPSQFSADFPAMLVIETLLGSGGDEHAFSYGSVAPAPDDFVGGYYQFEAQPGVLVEFFNGENVDRDLHNLEDGVTRMRSGLLPADLLNRVRSVTLGEFLTSVATLDDQSWLLGRAALSPSGVGFENALPARISAVSAADVLRVARKYLVIETIAVVLPNAQGQ
jgi:zinc protease